MRLKSLVLIILSLIAIAGCSKKSAPEPVPISQPAEDIYVTGFVVLNGHHLATYWKNGKEINLETQTESAAGAIAISGSDVYIAGNKTFDGITHPVVWKNGAPTVYGAGVAYGIALMGNDVYVTGYQTIHLSDNANTIDNYNVATYWKNGQAIALESPFTTPQIPVNAAANAIAISGNNVYMGGYSNISYGFGRIAILWTNGHPTPLTKAYIYSLSDESDVNQIVIHGNDVYAMGYVTPATGPESLPSGYSGAVYWKNGNIVQLPNDPVSSPTYSLTFSGSDMYLAGSPAITPPAPFYLKNMVPTPLQYNLKQLPGADLLSEVGQITVYNSDVYVAGSLFYRRSNQPDESLAFYWKNGIAVQLPSSNLIAGLQLGCGASGIAVVKHQ